MVLSQGGALPHPVRSSPRAGQASITAGSPDPDPTSFRPATLTIRA